MKPNNIIFITASLICFCVLSVVSFVYANGDYSGDFICVYSIAASLFLLSLLGMIFPIKTYKLLAKIGNKLLSTSIYGDTAEMPKDDINIERTQSYAFFNKVVKGCSAVSNILLVVLIIIVLA